MSKSESKRQRKKQGKMTIEQQSHGTRTCSSSRRDRLRAAAATRTPARTSTCATAQPMPDEAPVTTATRPCQRFMPSGIDTEAPESHIVDKHCA
jgi:hypothetical protein